MFITKISIYIDKILWYKYVYGDGYEEFVDRYREYFY